MKRMELHKIIMLLRDIENPKQIQIQIFRFDQSRFIIAGINTAVRDARAQQTCTPSLIASSK